MKNLKYPICFPVYKHRKTTILDRLKDLKGLPENVYCFMYDFDKENYCLDDYKDIKNLTIVPVSDEYKTSMKMRMFIQNYMGDRKFWMFDDDVSSIQWAWKEENKGHIEKIGMPEAFSTIEEVSDKENFAILGPTLSQVNFYWSSSREDFTINGFPCIACLIDGKLLSEKGVHYTGDTEVNEDYEIWVNSRRAGLKCGVATGINLRLDEKVNGKDSWVDNERNFKIHLHNYLKFGNDFKLFWNEKTDDICASRPRGKWTLKERVWHPELVNKCNEYLAGNLSKEDFKDFLIKLGRKY